MSSISSSDGGGGQPLVEIRNGLHFRLEHPDLAKPRNLTPSEKIALEKHERLLAAKAETRQPECWTYDCDRPCLVWVAEVSFDFKGDKAAPVVHAQISSADYSGAVPGFCWRHASAEWAVELARAVYFNRPEIAHGARPTRWFVVYTDGSRAGGPCVQVN